MPLPGLTPPGSPPRGRPAAPGGIMPPRRPPEPRMVPLRFLALAALLLAGAARAAGPAQKPTLVEKTLRALEKEIEKVRGLKFKKPVAARVVARPENAGPGIQGYYDTATKTLTL